MVMPIFILNAKAAFIMEQMGMLNVFYWFSGMGFETLTRAVNLIF